MRWRARRRRRWGGPVAAAVVVMALGGCVGTTDRDDFDRIIQERGGGFTSELPLAAVDAVRQELGVADFALRSMGWTPSAETVVMEVRDPAVPENLDRYVVRGGDIDAVEPVRLGADDDLDVETVPVSSVALDRVEQMVDVALAEFDPRYGYVTSMAVTRSFPRAVEFTLAMESARASATARFTAAGELVEVSRS